MADMREVAYSAGIFRMTGVNRRYRLPVTLFCLLKMR